MVGAYCASSSLLPRPLTTTAATTTAATSSLKPPHSSSNSTPPLPLRKLTRRKNRLRPKILKTLPKPLILPPPPEPIPIIPIIAPPENDIVLDCPTLKTGGIVPVVEELERSQLSATEGVGATEYGAVSGNSITDNSLLRIGLGLVGVFVLQTICSIWILGKASKDEKDENSKVVEKNVSGLNDVKFVVSEEVGCLDKKRLEYRINEIRAMAREARKIEAENVGGEGEMVDEDVGLDGIGKEVSARLVKMERKMGLRNGKLLGLNLNDLDESEEDEEAEEYDEEADEDENLVFKKKFKFRSPSSIGSRSDVKGFGLDGRNMYEKKKSGFGGLSDGSMEEKGSDALMGNVSGSRHDVEGFERVLREKEVGGSSMRFGAVQGTSQERTVEVTKSRQSTALGKQNLQKFKEEKSAWKSDRDVVMGRNNGSKHSVLGKKPDVKSDSWWMRLPYVLAILMRRGPEHEEAGFFTLRSTSQPPCTVAFENHGDANNFCCLLDSYFEDLGDFHADIIPLPVKELHDAVKSNTKNVIVVKKGQLKLYAGQSFADVEMALHSLIE